MEYLSIIGLVLDIAGAWMIAYEILWGYPKKNRNVTIQTKLDNLNSFVEEMRSSIKLRAQPPYTPEEIKKQLEEFNNKFEPKITELEKQVKVYTEQHPIKSFYVALGGIILLTIGFTLQIMGAIHSL